MIGLRRRIAAAALLAISAPLLAQSAPPSVSTHSHWLDHYAATADGGFARGNPDAPVKLIEYFSASCPACHGFYDESRADLDGMIERGQLYYELRTLVLPHPHDLALDVLIQCGTPAQSFALTDRFFARYDAIWSAVAKVSRPQIARWQRINNKLRAAEQARVLGLIEDAQQAGISPAQASKCLHGVAPYQKVNQILASADRLNINSTPSFILNGTKVSLGSEDSIWATLKPQIVASLAAQSSVPAAAPVFEKGS